MQRICAVGLLLGIGACGPGRVELSELSPAAAREQMRTSFADMNGSVVELRDGVGGQILLDIFAMEDGSAQARWWLEDMIEALATALDTDGVSRDSRFDFGARAGTYSWLASSSTWSKSAGDAITLLFPDNQDSSRNNLNLSLTDYQDAGVTFDDEEVYLPTAMTASLKHNDQRVGGLTWDMMYDESADFGMPLEANIELFFAPFLVSLAYERPEAARFTGSITLTSSSCSASMSVDLTLAHEDIQAFDPAEDFTHATVTLTYDALKVVASVDARRLSEIGAPTATEINAAMDADVFWENKKIAELVVRDPPGQERTVAVVYSDRSEEKAEVLYKTFLDTLEADFAPYFGRNWLQW